MNAVDKALAAAEIAASDAGLAIDSHDKSRAMRLAIEAALVEMLPSYIGLQKQLALAEAKLEAVRKVADDLEQYAADMFSSCGWENADGQSVISETAQAAADDIRKVLAQ